MDTHIAVPSAEADQPATVPVATSFIEALAARDFEALERLFGAQVRFRAIVPRGVREAATAQGAVGWLRRWFGDADSVELLESEASTVADRACLRYRFRVHEAGQTTLIEQHGFADVVDGRIADLSLLCSGFRPVDDAAAVDDAPAVDDAAAVDDAPDGIHHYDAVSFA